MAFIPAAFTGASVGSVFASGDFDEEGSHSRAGGTRTIDQERRRERNAHLARLYDSGRNGEKRPESLDEEERQAFEGGEHDRREERGETSGAPKRSADRGSQQGARARHSLRSGASPIFRQAGRHVSSAGRAVSSGVGSLTSTSGSGLDPWGVLVGVLALIGLYLLLAHSGLTASVTGGVLHAAQWFVSPKTLPF